MPIQTFSSFEAHAAAVQNASMRATLIGKVTTPWTMRGLMLPKLRAQWGQVGAGNIVEGTVIPRGVSIFVPTHNAHVVQLNGHRFDSQTLRLQIPSDEFCISSMASHCWFSVFIPDEVLAGWNATEATTLGSSSGFIRLPSDQAETFRRAVAQLGLIVHREPEAFESAAAIHGTTRKLEELVREALCSDLVSTPKVRRDSLSRSQVVHEVMDFVDQRDGEYLAVSELAAAADVSERTLRTAFQEHFGVGPVRYLKFRTLNLVHKALQNADPSLMTVTQVATRFGVWELGRFAQDYRLLFDELPSETLRSSRKTSPGVA